MRLLRTLERLLGLREAAVDDPEDGNFVNPYPGDDPDVGRSKICRVDRGSYMLQLDAAEKWRKREHERLTTEGYEHDGMDGYWKKDT